MEKLSFILYGKQELIVKKKIPKDKQKNKNKQQLIVQSVQ